MLKRSDILFNILDKYDLPLEKYRMNDGSIITTEERSCSSSLANVSCYVWSSTRPIKVRSYDGFPCSIDEFKFKLEKGDWVLQICKGYTGDRIDDCACLYYVPSDEDKSEDDEEVIR